MYANDDCNWCFQIMYASQDILCMHMSEANLRSHTNEATHLIYGNEYIQLMSSNDAWKSIHLIQVKYTIDVCKWSQCKVTFKWIK